MSEKVIWVAKDIQSRNKTEIEISLSKNPEPDEIIEALNIGHKVVIDIRIRDETGYGYIQDDEHILYTLTKKERKPDEY